MGVRRFYHRHFGYHVRFHLAVVVTILAVAFVIVPRVARLVGALQGYNPVYYEPKDLSRSTWAPARPFPMLDTVDSVDLVLNVVLLFLVAVVWLLALPAGDSRRR